MVAKKGKGNQPVLSSYSFRDTLLGARSFRACGVVETGHSHKVSSPACMLGGILLYLILKEVLCSVIIPVFIE